MRSARWVLGLLLMALGGCGGDLCDDAREAFCQKACDCPDGPCVVVFGNAAFQYFDSVEECVDIAGPQICDPGEGDERAQACANAVQAMDSCGADVAPDECTVFAPGAGTTSAASSGASSGATSGGL
jgi:hypothetical protein